jgi:hypothetical protein
MPNSYMITNRQDVNGTSPDDTQPLPGGGLWFYLSDAGANDTNATDYGLTPDANGQASVSPPADFLSALQADLNATVTNDTAQLVIFIHGLANSFSSAIDGTGTLGAGLAQAAGFGGLVIGFSWPSFALFDSVVYYGKVRENINGSLESFASLFETVQTLRAGLPAGANLNLSVVCHSEGNYMLMRGMNYLYNNPPSSWHNIDNVLMLAADINDAALQLPDGNYLGWGWPITRLSHQVTVYYSYTDPELALSTATYYEYHNKEYPIRLGTKGPYSFEQGALEINTFGVDCNLVVNLINIAWLKLNDIIPWYVLEHSSYIYIPQILVDMAQTMSGVAPGDVVNRYSVNAPDGQSYEMAVEDSGSAEFGEFEATFRNKNAILLPLRRISR